MTRSICTICMLHVVSSLLALYPSPSDAAGSPESIDGLVGLSWYSYCDMTTFGDALQALVEPKTKDEVSIERTYPWFTQPSLWSVVGNDNQTVSYQLPNAVLPTVSNPSAYASPMVECHAFPTTTAYYDWRQDMIAKNQNVWLPQRPLPTETHFDDFNNGTAMLVECSVFVTLIGMAQQVQPTVVAGSPLHGAIRDLPPALNESTWQAFDSFHDQFRGGYLAAAYFGGLVGLDIKVAAHAVSAGGLSLSSLESESSRIVDNVLADRKQLDGVSTAFYSAILVLGTGLEDMNVFNVVRGGTNGSQPLPAGTNASTWRGLVQGRPAVTQWTCEPWENIIEDAELQSYRTALNQYRSRVIWTKNRVIQEQLHALPDG